MDKLKQGFWKFTGLNFKWKHEHKQRRRGKQSEENRGQQLQSSFALLEHFPKSIFYMLYTISKLRKSTINASNGARFGVETKELQPLEADHSKLKEDFCMAAKSAFCYENFAAILHSARVFS